MLKCYLMAPEFHCFPTLTALYISGVVQTLSEYSAYLIHTRQCYYFIDVLMFSVACSVCISICTYVYLLLSFIKLTYILYRTSLIYKWIPKLFED